MINPSEINLSSLPWLPLGAKSAFPQNPAIYFAVDSQGVVQYIGRALDPKARWRKHHRYNELEAIGVIKIVYLFIDSPELLPEIESALIQWFKPALNVFGKRLEPQGEIVPFSIKVNADFYERYKTKLRNEEISITEDIENYMRSRISEKSAINSTSSALS